MKCHEDVEKTHVRAALCFLVLGSGCSPGQPALETCGTNLIGKEHAFMIEAWSIWYSLGGMTGHQTRIFRSQFTAIKSKIKAIGDISKITGGSFFTMQLFSCSRFLFPVCTDVKFFQRYDMKVKMDCFPPLRAYSLIQHEMIHKHKNASDKPSIFWLGIGKPHASRSMVSLLKIKD